MKANSIYCKNFIAAWAEYYKTMGQYQQYYQQQRT